MKINFLWKKALIILSYNDNLKLCSLGFTEQTWTNRSISGESSLDFHGDLVDEISVLTCLVKSHYSDPDIYFLRKDKIVYMHAIGVYIHKYFGPDVVVDIIDSFLWGAENLIALSNLWGGIRKFISMASFYNLIS